MMNIIEQAFAVVEAVAKLKVRVKLFYYAVVVSGHRCPRCNGGLEMLSESQARCTACGYKIDPTVVFQRCACGGKPELVIRRYRCRQCGSDIQSRFLFDGLAFDAEYFRQKVVESRQRKHAKREQIRKLLAESRSDVIQPPPADLESMPTLAEALNALTQGLEPSLSLQPSDGFNLKRYQSHIQAHLQPFPITLADIPPLSENLRKDRIWRFIAIIFLAHAGVVEIWQDGQDIMVRKNETDTKGQGVPGDLEATDEIERAVC